MNKIIFFVILIIACVRQTTAQTTTSVLKQKSLVKGQTIYLNSKARLGGKNRIVVPIQLPANTVSWTYSFSAVITNNAGRKLQGSGLEMQIARLIADGALNIIGAGVVTNVVGQLIKPTGSGVVDIYLTDAKGLKQFEQKDLVGMNSVNVPAFYKEGTAQNSRNGVFQIPIIRNDLFLCLRNPSVTEGVAVSIDVVAIVATKQYSDVWTAKNIDLLYTDCLSKFNIVDSEAEKICDCTRNKIKNGFTPSSFTALSVSEKESIIQSNIRLCSDETGFSSSVSKDIRIKEIMKLIKGQRITKDYQGAVKSYKELLSLGIDTSEVYEGLVHSQLNLGQFEEARKNLTVGLGKNPDDPDLFTNLGHYYLLTGKYDEAMAVYEKYKKKKLDNKQKFRQVVSDDLKEFERLGFGNSHFDQVRKNLRID